MPTYPFIQFVVKYKTALAWVIGALMLVIFLGAAILMGQPIWIVPGLLLGGLFWFLVRLMGEVIQVISETLLPR